jgi:hypothetical protein
MWDKMVLRQVLGLPFKRFEPLTLNTVPVSLELFREKGAEFRDGF